MNIFTYGTLMDPEIMAEVSGLLPDSLHVRLPGHARYCVSGEEYPGMVRELGAEVNGVLYLDVPPEAVRRLDLFEGELYQRLEVECLEGSETYPAMAYVVKPEHEDTLTREPWDFDAFLKGGGKELFQRQYGGFEEINHQ